MAARSSPLRLVLHSLLGCFLLASSYGQLSGPMHRVERLTPLPTGLYLPVEIHHGLRAGKARPGEEVVAKTTQWVLLGRHRYLSYGSRWWGRSLPPKHRPQVIRLC